jgi:hypothetical protein
MKAEFSEFTYGAAVARELVAALGPDIRVHPLLPPTEEHGGQGDEASFHGPGQPVFLHYRVAECMLTPRATGWSAHENRFFRLTVPQRSHSNLHDLLRRLSEAEAEVYYAAPAFYRRREFSRAFALGQVIEGSRFMPLRQLPYVGEGGPYYITYRRDEPGFRWHSMESRYFKGKVSGSDWLLHLRGLAGEPRQLGWRFLLQLRETLVAAVQETTPQPRLFDELALSLDDVTPRAVLRDLRYLLLAHCALQALVLRPA